MARPSRADQPRYTYADLLAWLDDARWELLDGAPYAMTPAPSTRHQAIISELMTQFGMLLREHPCRHFTAPFDVRLPAPAEDGMTASTVVQPDLVVVCERTQLDEHGCVGAPTLVIEVTSPTTATRDFREKRAVYERAGVPEYWLILPDENMVLVFTLTDQGRYGAPAVYAADEQLQGTVLPEVHIDLPRVFAT